MPKKLVWLRAEYERYSLWISFEEFVELRKRWSRK